MFLTFQTAFGAVVAVVVVVVNVVACYLLSCCIMRPSSIPNKQRKKRAEITMPHQVNMIWHSFQFLAYLLQNTQLQLCLHRPSIEQLVQIFDSQLLVFMYICTSRYTYMAADILTRVKTHVKCLHTRPARSQFLYKTKSNPKRPKRSRNTLNETSASAHSCHTIVSFGPWAIPVPVSQKRWA